MTAFTNERIGVSFELPERLSVRAQLHFRIAVAAADDTNWLIRYWQAALPLLSNWQCEALPDPAALDIDTADDPALTNIVQWTANTVAGFMLQLETPAKN